MNWKTYEAWRKARIPWGDLDQNMVRLIKALNAIPGCTTRACCGGHDPKEHQGQAGKDEYYVSMLFAQNWLGWQALNRVTQAVQFCRPEVWFTPTASDDGLLDFWLSAKGDPDTLAKLLEDEDWIRTDPFYILEPMAGWKSAGLSQEKESTS